MVALANVKTRTIDFVVDGPLTFISNVLDNILYMLAKNPKLMRSYLLRNGIEETAINDYLSGKIKFSEIPDIDMAAPKMDIQDYGIYESLLKKELRG